MIPEWGERETYLYSEDVGRKFIRNIHIYTKLHGVTLLKTSSEIYRIATKNRRFMKLIQ